MAGISPGGLVDTGHRNQVPGNVAHLLSGECPALQPYLTTTLHHIPDMLGHHPDLLYPALAALQGDREAVTTFLLDPSTDPYVIKLVQQYGQGPVLHPMFRTRMRMLEHFL